jgi:transketolase
MIIANTVKGKGVSFLEGQAGYHNAAIDEDQMQRAVAELEAVLSAVEGN